MKLTKKDLDVIEFSVSEDKPFVLFDKIETIKADVEKSKEDIETLEKEVREIELKEGPQGIQGEKGDSIIGPMGPEGKMGPMGPAGEDGESIVGPKGDRGDDGKDGKDLDESVVEELRDEIKRLQSELAKAPKQVGGFKALRAAVFSFNCDGATTSFNLPKAVGAKGKAIWIYYNGQYIQQGVHFVLKNKTLDTSAGTSPFTPESGTVLEGFFLLF